MGKYRTLGILAIGVVAVAITSQISSVVAFARERTHGATFASASNLVCTNGVSSHPVAQESVTNESALQFVSCGGFLP